MSRFLASMAVVLAALGMGAVACVGSGPKIRGPVKHSLHGGAVIFPMTRTEVHARAVHPVLPPVDIQYVITEPVEVVRALETDEQGGYVDTPPSLKALTPVYVRDQRVRLEKGASVAIGDVVTEGLLENTDAATVTLVFADGSRLALAPEERVYIGPMSVLEVTHKGECHCKGKVAASECDVSIDASEAPNGCEGLDSSACMCEGSQQEGSLSGCHKVFVPVEATETPIWKE